MRTDLVYGGRSMKAGFKAADKSGAKLALVLGDRGLEAGNIGVKTLATGEQVDVALTDVIEAVRAALKPSALVAAVPGGVEGLASDAGAVAAEAVRETP